MTLIIAYILMTMVNAHWIWYPIVFIVWCIHCGFAFVRLAAQFGMVITMFDKYLAKREEKK